MIVSANPSREGAYVRAYCRLKEACELLAWARTVVTAGEGYLIHPATGAVEEEARIKSLLVRAIDAFSDENA